MAIPGATAQAGFTVPDTTPPTSALEDALDASVEDANRSAHRIAENGTEAASEAASFRVPARQIQASLTVTGDLANGSTERTANLSATLAGWAAEENQRKIDETNRTLAGAGELSAAAVNFTSAVLFATAETVCTRPLLDVSDPEPPACEGDSLVGSTLDEVE